MASVTLAETAGTELALTFSFKTSLAKETTPINVVLPFATTVTGPRNQTSNVSCLSFTLENCVPILSKNVSIYVNLGFSLI